MIKVIIAIPTPDKTNPAIAGQKWLPDWAPSAGGKIKFPAPKKIQITVNLLRNLFVTCVLLYIFQSFLV